VASTAEFIGRAMTRDRFGLRSRWQNPATRKLLLFAGIAAAVVYVCGDVLSGLIYDSSRPYSFTDQWISELTARGSPVRPLMVAFITVHNLLVAAFAVVIYRVAGQNRSLRWAGLALLAATAIGFVIHPLFPMSSRWMESGFTDTMHALLSGVWGMVTSACIVLAAIAFRGWFRVYSIVTVVVLIGCSVASSIAIAGIERDDTPWAGVFERVSAYGLMAWFIALSITVMRRCRGAPRAIDGSMSLRPRQEDKKAGDQGRPPSTQ